MTFLTPLMKRKKPKISLTKCSTRSGSKSLARYGWFCTARVLFPAFHFLKVVYLKTCVSLQMAKAPSAARGLPSASASSAATISDEEIERQLKALGVD